MIKRIISFVAVFCLFTCAVFAVENAFSITPEGMFISYTAGDDAKQVAKIMDISEEDFKNNCKQKNIIYFAVSKDRKKQIQVMCSETGFSNSIVNLSNLDDDNIHALMSELTGDANIRGEIIKKENQKFIRTQLSSSDSGGEYKVTEYMTVAGKKYYTLSFFTSAAEDDEYIEKTFETFETNDFYKQEKTVSFIKYVIPVGIGIFVLVSVVIVITLIKDIKNSELPEETSQQSYSENDDE